ncbi:winged helix-turn-helix domain-containing tetratricopeptide repeat protein [Bradyrhizobium jicamae]|uniref:winged helix-turn-helix domain-containing tetratricopeptide repeat protein n=1 Tax=Bradyrhizobium jicamae TaxID=280332 RepID=UPI001BAA6F37|nr:winged helix-turn-helix domain-containing tetratricopeptide repeat protein [Bradyrhizobium jicamae]MBR0935291.1 winged helix-turn-helix domain-containing protein [Bradyrhizobium jicamae]
MTIHEFGPYRLDAEAEMLFRGSEPVTLGRRAVTLLRLLVERAGAPVSKDALMQAAWPGLAIEESNLTVQIAALRRIFADVDGGATWIETLPRRGYRYVGPTVAAAGAGRLTTAGPAVSDRPSLAVLPFSNLSGDPGQDYFSDGITGDIIAELSRFRSLFVVARHSSFAYRGKVAEIKRVGRELGVRYVAEGSVRKVGSRVRVTVQLLDAGSGYSLWTERYDCDLEDIFPLQDEIVRAIVAALPGRLEDAGREIARRKPTSSVTAYDLVLLGNERWRQLTVKNMAQARDYFRRAVALDPQYARAHVNTAWTIVCDVFLESPAAATLDEALREIETALDIDDGDAWSHGVFAQLLFLRNEDAKAEIHFGRALALNPNDADVAAVFANILVYWGRWREALTWIGAAKRLNPFPPNLYHWYHALALYSGHEYERAVKALMEARSFDRWSHGLLAACYAQMGRFDEARSEAEAFVRERSRELNENGEAVPANTLDLVQSRAGRYRDPADREHLLDGLRRAGLTG